MSLELPPPTFEVGDFVRRVSAPDQAGQVKAVSWSDAAEVWQYQVRFLNGLRAVFQDDLARVDDDPDGVEMAAGARAFRTLITYERLNHPPTRIAASFGTARAAFYPYQFKPLLKFLESENGRILIADDVGLGKTIEAGYILRELRARKSIDQVLIVVPARLTYKWKDELERRFDERFEIVRRRDFHRLFQSLDAGREPLAISWITSYEAIRGTTIQERIEELSPPLDLVILDEAHRVRNPETLQHKVARALAECSESLVFLTATPVQTDIFNLFNLLRILLHEYDLSIEQFAATYEDNKPLVHALSALRTTPPDLEAARSKLKKFAASPRTSTLASRPFFQSIMERLSQPSLERRDRVILQRDLSELSLFGRLVSRTRKAEVLPNRPVREAVTQRVNLTAVERGIINDYADRVAASRDEGWGAQMSALMDFRYVASSIAGAMAHFERRSKERWSLQEELALTTESTTGWLGPARAEQAEEDPDAEPERARGSGREAPGYDSKFEAFLLALNAVWDGDRDDGSRERKVVVFSFFRETLKYLSSRLRGKGIEHRLIHGLVPIVEREHKIEEFLTHPEIRVLLSSEVGAEGLDLQSASVVVNYDLPWNPMVVEQRIGRIDRIGQRSKKIVIVNLVTAESIEETILERLYRRIQVFRESIGDLEEILGDTVEEIATQALQERLSEEQAIALAEQTADALERRITEARSLQARADEMLAADQSFLDEIHAIVDERKVPNPAELHRFLEGFFSDKYRGVDLPDGVIKGVAEAEFVPEVARDLERLVPGVDGRRIASRVRQGSFPVSFDPEAVLDAPRAELVGLGHPLVRLAVAWITESSAQAFRRFAVRLTPSKEIPRGRYAFDVRRFEVSGIRERSEVVAFAYSFNSERLLPEDAARALLLAMIDDGQDLLQSITQLRLPLAQASAALDRAIDAEQARIDREEKRLEEGRADQRSAIRQGQLESRLAAEKRRLSRMRYGSKSPRAIRSAEGRVAAAQDRLQLFLDEPPARGLAACQVGRIAEGIVIVD